MAFNIASRAAMPALRTAAAGAAARPALAATSGLARTQMFRRGYAEAVSDKLQLSLVLPHEALYQGEVTQVNIAATSGDMGILAAHVPSIEQLAPGLLEVVEQSGVKKWFVSGGFATVHPNNKLTINAIEAYDLDKFSPEAVRSALAEAQRVASGSGSAEDKAEAEIEVEVYTALQSALSK
ncbi:epsilon subunit of F1F0-ATP synthase N-terminal domain-containing protein [Acaromyces ingoldii]|uniref:ATP synthase subunit delta, mitochondrial n=1 Tax=Acaromyces ingoldii TaxID=215250 RepID=A0A316YPP0_9BASI|nr:epsilon subunit of F1F0-ATP synthase N-terminal domain-containing protein [Acaromyces ingoldii]PWN90996.1 epsilon subunit of F1F0-ATP synthase N-terminal domain-containing protein [Acaromyces ingoldii]